MDVLSRLKDVLDQVPVPEEKKKVLETVTCCACQKTMPMQQVKQLHTPRVNALDFICDACEAMVKNHARIVCLQCRQVTARIPPIRDVSGFEFKPKGVYHVTNCPICTPGSDHSSLIEKEEFDREMRKNKKS